MTLWRCSACGKWSHAQRRPRGHERFIPASEPLPEGARVLREAEPEYDWNGDGREGGRFVACGPFDAWTATPRTDEMPGQLPLPYPETRHP